MKTGRKFMHEDGETYLVNRFDAEPVKDLCHAMRQENREFDLGDGSGRLVASIPMALVEEAASLGVNLWDGTKETSDWLFSKLNGEWKAFKITSGNLAVSSGHV